MCYAHTNMLSDRAPQVEPQRHAKILSRRDLVLGGGAAGALLALLAAAPVRAGGTEGSAAAPVTAGPEQASRIPVSDGLAHSRQFEEALQAILNDAEPAVGEPLTLTLPELAENGNVVPYTIAVDSPMTDNDYVRTLHLLSTSNPQAVVATFHLIPATGKAMVSGRMRLAKTQDVVAIAEVSTGSLLVSVRKIEVTIGGCGNE